MLMTDPEIETRPERPYVGITRRVSMERFASVVPPLLGQVFAWLGTTGIDPAGPPFFRYAVIDMSGEMEVSAGVPTAEPVGGDDEIESGTIPAGKYVTAVHTGHPQELMEATRRLLDWAESRGVTWAMHPEPDGEHWDGRFEFYFDSPDDEPDMTKWRTELAFLTA
jgi:effector-binding domain-containing protein